ncbi:MAG: DUF2018 family protein [Sulfurimonas sp.]|jgi:hypothetical protein|nr:DUF2018 family protein [Sulfurimonadaceae bacterium]
MFLYEDEDDIFMGSPKSKLMDIIFNANNDVVRFQLENFINKMAALELLVEEKLGESIDERELRDYIIAKADEVDDQAKTICINLMGDIVSQSE